MNDTWEAILAVIKEKITPVHFNLCFSIITPVALTDSVLLLEAHNELCQTLVNKLYFTILDDAVTLILGKKIKIILKFNIDNNFKEQILQQYSNSGNNSVSNNKNLIKKHSSENNSIDTYVSSPLNSKYVFENFVVGNSNQLAYAAAVAVAEAPGTAYNPLFLYGNVGLGKTHLMHSIAHHILEHNPSAKVVYASCETFLNELIGAIQNKKTDAFRNKYRKVDALLIDDVQFISNKEGTQVEFFHTFNAISELNKQIIISSDRPPKEISLLEDRLRSRFSSGLIADIQLPDFETRTAILKRKAKLEGIDMPEDVFRFIAKTISSSIRELEGALTTISAYSKLTNAEITVSLAKLALKDMIINSEKQDLSIEYIQSTIANYFNVSVEELKGKRRSKNIVYPRHIAMYFCRKLLDSPLSDIGAAFGGRDHSTVINAYDNIIKGIENSNPGVKKNIAEIEAILKKD